jgi:enoyl-CoA hydratase
VAEPEPASLPARQEPIDRCFAPETVEGILDALSEEAAGGGAHAEWAAQTRTTLLAKSPTSLKITLHQLVAGRDFDLDAALILEYRLTQHVMAGHDFYEGVRAVVVDKDQMPRWQPATLAEVDKAMVEAYFAPIGARELRFE